MPPRKSQAADSGTPADQAPAARRPRARSRPGASDDAPQTLAQFLGARDTADREADDSKTQTRSFPLLIRDVQRLRATADGIQHVTYQTPLQDEVPDSISGLLSEFIRAGCTYYENMLNNGQEFPRVRKLPPGPGRSGAQRGAAIRSEQAARRREAAANSPAD
jgi:hypothetical protein